MERALEPEPREDGATLERIREETVKQITQVARRAMEHEVELDDAPVREHAVRSLELEPLDAIRGRADLVRNDGERLIASQHDEHRDHRPLAVPPQVARNARDHRTTRRTLAPPLIRHPPRARSRSSALNLLRHVDAEARTTCARCGAATCAGRIGAPPRLSVLEVLDVVRRGRHEQAFRRCP
ncbi:MAG: hypothetical protein R3F34_00780 [Planctomycetota bacterium]